jgi:hypothetical protein
LSGKPGLTAFRKFSVQLAIGRLGASTTKARLANPDRIERFALARAQTHIRLVETAPGASLLLSILQPG